MQSKKILISGANKGIGLEIAKQLSVLNHIILMTGRSMEKLEKAKQSLPQKEKVFLYEMDVSK